MFVITHKITISGIMVIVKYLQHHFSLTIKKMLLARN